MKTKFMSFLAFCLSFSAIPLFADTLPVGYSKVAYLQSDGVAYIDTGYKPNGSTKLEMTLAVRDQGGDFYVFGADDRKLLSNMSLWWETFNTGAGGYMEAPGSNYITPTSGNAGLKNTEYKNCRLSYDAGVFTLVNLDDDKTAVFDMSAGFDQSGKGYQFQNSIYIFARHGSSSDPNVVVGQHSLSQITSFKIWEGDTLVRDLVPAYSEKSACLGFYDVADHSGEEDYEPFYANAAATGTFYTEITGTHRRLNYLGGTGVPYIDTGYVFKTRPRIECGLCINSAADSDIMGNETQKEGCFIVDYNDNARTIYYRYGNSNGNSSMTATYPSAIKGKWIEAVYDTTITHDGVQVGTEVTNYDFSKNEQVFRIFRGRYNNMAVRYSYVRVYDNDVLVRDYIPAEVNGTLGLWDRLSQTLYENAAGSGSFEAGVAIPAQPGDFSVLEVVGSPANYGIVEPAYGQHAAAPGEVATCTAADPEPTDAERVSLVGWEVYHDGNLVVSGETSTATFDYGSGRTTLKWLWGGKFFVTFAAGSHGSVTNASAWHVSGETVPVLAVPDEGFEFIGWKGVPAEQAQLNPLPFVVDGARTIEAVFASPDVKRLEYIGSTSLKQYIDTGYVFTNLPAVVARMMMMDAEDRDFLGMPSAKADCFIVDYADGNKNLYYRYADASYKQGQYGGSSGALNGKWFDCAWSNIVWHGNHKIIDFSANDYTGKFATNTQKFYLFGGRTFGKVRFGNVKMYDGEELVRDYIPAKLNGVVGMWDRVERKFYKNAKDASAFEEGPAVMTEPGDFATSHTITAGEGGTVKVSDSETPLGEWITLTATPEQGRTFAGWVGNVPAAVAAEATATFIVTEPLVVQATFAADVPFVVDPAGEGDFTSLDEAVAETAGLVGKILIKSGTYAVTNTLVVSGGMTLVPESGQLGDVVLCPAGDFPVVELTNPLARLSNLIVSNGYVKDVQKGANVTLTAGTVQNCLITGGRMSNGAAAGAYLTGGVLRDSVIRGNVTVGDQGGAVGVYAKGEGTLVENCDVCCNTNLMNWQIGYLVHSGGIKLDGGVVRNCFVTNNVNLGHGNLYVTGGGRVEDTVVADNVGGFYFDTLSGGGFVPAGGSATFTRTTFARNSGYGVGGLYAGGSVVLYGVKAYGNTAVVGGTDGNMDVRGCDTAGIDFTNPDEKPVTRVADVYLPADTADLCEAVRRCADGGTVHVAAGDYLISGEVIVDRPVRIVGEGAEQTVFARDPSVWYTRLVNLRHADAVLEGVTVRDGQRLAANCVNVFRGTLRQAVISDVQQEGPCLIWKGGTVSGTLFANIASDCRYSGHGTAASLMEAGALLENCTFEKCDQAKNYTDGDLVRLDGGLISRCVFRENKLNGSESCCVGLTGPGVVESSLFTHNDGSWYTGAGFHVNGSGWEVRNCTVVSNLSEYAGAAVYWSTNANIKTMRSGSFVNCIFYRNHCKKDLYPENFDVSAGNGTQNVDVTFRNCLFTTAEAAAAQGERAVNPLSGDPKFRSLTRRDYHLAAGSPCRNAGFVWEGADDPSVTDIDGRRLSQFGLIDVGCHASSRKGFMCIVR